MSAAREILHGFKNALLELLERTFRLAGQKLLESRDAKELVIGIHGLGHTIAEKDERVAGLQLEAGAQYSASGTKPTGKEPSVKASSATPRRIRKGEGWPALMNSRWPS